MQRTAKIHWRLLIGLVAAAAGGWGLVYWLATRPENAASSPQPPVVAGESADAAPAGETAERLTAPVAVELSGVDHQVAEAIRAAQRELRQEPDSALAWGRLAMVLHAHEFVDDALRCYEQAQLRAGHDPQWPYLRAISIVRGEPLAALPLLERAAALAEDDPPAPRLRLLELYLELDRLDDVDRPLAQFLEGNPQNARAHLVAARLAVRREQLDQALTHLEQALADPAAQSAGRLLRAEIYQRQGRKDDAEAERSAAGELKPTYWPDPFYSAVGRFQTGLKRYLKQADSLYVQGKNDQALALLERLVRAYPDAEWAWILLGRSQIRARQLRQASVSLGRALAINPDSTDAQFRMGVVHQLQGSPGVAESWFRSVLKQKPDHSVAHYNLAICRLNLGDKEGAVLGWTKAVECDADYLDALVALGQALLELGRGEQARPHLERALRVKPDHAQARALWSQLEERAAEPPADGAAPGG